MRALFANGYNDTDWLLRGLANVGYYLSDGDKVLDFGCGAGGMVYAFRDRGYDAYGFDIYPYVDLREEADRCLFRVPPTNSGDPSDTRFDPATFRIDFADRSFDLIFSTSTLEHVTDIAPVMAEISRLLKPDGIAIHVYPDPSVFIEPHVFVPLASRFQARWWFYLWGLAGVRNQFQREMSAREVADNNVIYCKKGLRYWSWPQLYSAASPHFAFIWRATDRFHAGVTAWDEWLRRWRALRSGNVFAELAQVPRLECLVLGKPLLASATVPPR